MEQIIKEEIGRLETQIGHKFEELKKDRITSGEFKEFSEKVDKKISELERSLVELKRPGLGKSEKDDMQTKVFGKFVRVEPLSPEERKTLTVGTANAGGYIAPAAFYEELVKYLVEASPIRKYARVITASGPVINIPKITSRTGASWVGEGGAISTETQPVFGQTSLKKCKVVSIQKVSWELVRDAKFNIEKLLRELFAEDIAKSEGAAFVNGDGSDKPYGITHATNGGTQVLTATAATFVADDLINLVYSIKTRYLSDAILGMNRAIMKTVRTFKTTTGEYLWEPDFQNGTPGRVLGLPLVEIPDLDDTVAATKNIAICGSLKAGFWIVDDGEMEVIVADQLYAANGLVGYIGVKWQAAGVVLPEAIAYLKVKSGS